MATFLVVRQSNESHAPVAYYEQAPSKAELLTYFSDWDSDTPEVEWTTLVVKKVKDLD